MSYRLGVDVGGTFTDIMLFDESTKKMTLSKVPTTVENPAMGIINGVEKITRLSNITSDEITLFMHGTTAATNAVLEGKGAKTALIVTEGFRDILHIMRQDRPKLYDFFAMRPLPLAPRHLRFEAAERILHTGQVLKKLDESQIKKIIKRIKHHKVQAVAICLLHSYCNPAHEQRIKELLLRDCPGLYVSISSEVLPKIKEYERMSTTVINAYVLPIIKSYLGDLSRRLADIGVKRTVHIMQSNAGIIPSSMASTMSANTILSGPAAGVLGGVAIAKQAGVKNVITVDMGGTSFDICLAYQGKPKITSGSEIGGHALMIPMVDIHTIGAGGGSIAWIDSGGVLKVGPQSAGANPGPVCYKKNGTEPTVTDANLVLGRLNPEYFLGGQMEVDKDASYKAIETKLAKPLGMSVFEVAEGIVRIVNTSMVKGIRYVSVEKGYDPREFALVCFGGNGPVHSAELAEELAVPQIIIPFAPGVNCAYGLLIADFRCDFVRTYLKKLSRIDLEEINSLYKDMEDLARGKMKDEGFSPREIIINRTVDMRYLGQSYELEVPTGPDRITRKELEAVRNRFDLLHNKSYGFSKTDEPTEIVNLRVACTGVVHKAQLKKAKLAGANPQAALKGRRKVFMKGQFRQTSIYDRNKLMPGNQIKGPAIIEQKDSTTVLFPENVAQIDSFRNIVVKINSQR